MFVYLVFVVAAFLALRSLVLGMFEKKSIAKKSVDFLLCALFSLGSVLLFYRAKVHFTQNESASLFAFLALLAAFAIPLFLRLARKKHSSFFALGKTIFLIFFCLSALLTFTLSLFQRFTENKPIMRVIITGNVQSDKHQVILEWIDGERREEFFLLGDLVAVRARILRFAPWLNFLGYDNLFYIEAVYGSYRDMAHFNTLPMNGYAISQFSPMRLVHKWIWDKWETLFFQEDTCSWIKSATIESNYFPLLSRNSQPFRGTYLLTINFGGLSAQNESGTAF